MADHDQDELEVVADSERVTREEEAEEATAPLATTDEVDEEETNTNSNSNEPITESSPEASAEVELESKEPINTDMSSIPSSSSSTTTTHQSTQETPLNPSIQPQPQPPQSTTRPSSSVSTPSVSSSSVSEASTSTSTASDTTTMTPSQPTRTIPMNVPAAPTTTPPNTAASKPQPTNQPHPTQPQQQQQQQPIKPLTTTAPLPYTPSIAPSVAHPTNTSSDSSFWDLFSSNAPQAKVSRELLEWVPDLSQPPPVTSLGEGWLKNINSLSDLDRATGHLPPYALRFGFIDELGDYHAMLEWANENGSTSTSGTSGGGGGTGHRTRRENKHTHRAREAAKEILSSIQHHRIGGVAHPTRLAAMTVNGRQQRVPTLGQVIVNGNVQSATATTGPPGSVTPSTTTSNPTLPNLAFSPPPTGPLTAATHPLFPRNDLPDTNWWLLTNGDGI